MSVYTDKYQKISWSSSDSGTRGSGSDRRSRSVHPTIFKDYEAYECPVTGKIIEGRSAHRENLKVTGCRLLEPGEKEDNARAAQDAIKAEDARRDAVIDQMVDSVAHEYFSNRR